MPMFIVLGTFSDQGARDAPNVRQFAEENSRRAQQLGMKGHGWYLTMGRYDDVVIAEAPDDETMAAQILGVASQGRAHTEMLRAFTLDEADAIIQKIGQEK